MQILPAKSYLLDAVQPSVCMKFDFRHVDTHNAAPEWQADSSSL